MSALTAVQLRGWEERLHHGHQHLARDSASGSAADRAIAEHGSGEALSALGELLAEGWRGCMEVLEEMRQTAEILARTAGLQDQLELAMERMRDLLDSLPLLDAFSSLIHLFGQRLDERCAAEISAVCKELPAPPTNYLRDYPHASLDAMHATVLLDHPELSGLAEENPDLRFVEAGEGMVAAVVGDLDAADSVTTVVSGVGSSSPSAWEGACSRAREVSRSTGGAAVAWLGYEAPGVGVAAVGSRHARQGARQLRAFQDALASRNPDQRRIVVGHSYGSTVTGWAAADADHPLAADSVVLLGSPGVPQRSAEEFHLTGNGGVHAGTYLGDPIGHAAGATGGVHGTDPSSRGFGSRLLDKSDRFLGHSDYWDDPALAARLRELAQ